MYDMGKRKYESDAVAVRFGSPSRGPRTERVEGMVGQTDFSGRLIERKQPLLIINEFWHAQNTQKHDDGSKHESGPEFCTRPPA